MSKCGAWSGVHMNVKMCVQVVVGVHSCTL